MVALEINFVFSFWLYLIGKRLNILLITLSLTTSSFANDFLHLAAVHYISLEYEDKVLYKGM